MHDAHHIATVLGITYEWVLAQARAGQYPHHRIGRLVRFTDEDLAAIISAAAVEATARPITHLAPACRRRHSYPTYDPQAKAALAAGREV